MKSILLIGLGRFGRHIAIKLNEMGHEIMAIETDEQRVNDTLPIVTSALIGDSTNPDFLSSLGVRNFDACIVAIGDDFQNSLETASLLKELGARRVVARASTDVQEKFLLRNGADEVVYPEKQLAAWTAIRCTMDHITDYFELDGDNSIVELTIPEKWHTKSILDLDIRRKYNINILGIRKNGCLDLNVPPETVLSSGETILVLGPRTAIQKCFHIS